MSAAITSLDLAFLATGSVLAMTGIAASAMARLDRRPDWHWLATFAFLRAASPWLQMITLNGQGSLPARELIGSFCEVIAGVALLEYARQSGQNTRVKSVGRWVHLVVLGSTLPLAFSMRMDPLRTAGAVATLIGGLCAANGLVKSLRRDEDDEGHRLRHLLAFTLGLFSVVASASSFFGHPSSTREGAAPSPLLWAECGATVFLAAGMLLLYSYCQYKHLARHARAAWTRRAAISLAVILTSLCVATALIGLLDLPRLPVLLVSLLFVLLTTVSYHAQERIREEVSQVAHSEQRSRMLIDSSPNATLLFDHRGRCELLNRSARMVFGLTEAESIQRAFVDFWPATSQSAVRDAVLVSLGGTPSRFDAEYVHADGRKVTLSVAMNPAINADGVVQGFVAVAADVTVRRKSELALLSAKATAETAAQAKSEFLAVMTHEIRTPLGGVIGLLESLKRMPQPPNQRRQTEVALDSAESLLEILDHILDAAKIEAAQFTLSPKPFNPVTELSRITEGQRIRAENANLELVTHFAADLPRGLIGDATRLRQVLSNLLTNAIKFTPSGRVAVRVGGEAHPGRTYLLRIEVSDTGVGIRSEMQAKLFGRPQENDFASTRQFGSAGLGLAIIRTIVDLMGGEIRVASESGQGTTVTVEAVLPLAETTSDAPFAEGDLTPEAPKALAMAPAEEAPVPAAPAGDSGPLKILCAEDNPTNRLIIQLLLEPMGHEIHFAEDGAQAVARLSETQFDVVLMDNRMPVMDGFQATRVIRDRKSNVLNHDVPVIALTANASKSYRDQCIESGMNDYLTKPVREPALRASLNRAMRGRVKVPRGPMAPKVLEAANSTTSGRTQPPLPLTTRVTAAPFVPPPLSPPTPIHETTPVGQEGLSEDQLLALLDDAEQAPVSDPSASMTPEARTRISQQYLKETPRLLNSMRVAWASRDAATLGRAGHSLKSSSRYVRAEKLSEMGSQIETLADRAELANVGSLIEQTDREFAMVSERLLVEIQS